MAIGPDYSVRPYADKYARDETPVSESDLRSIQKMADNVDSKKWGIDTRYSISSSMRLMDEVIKDTLGRQGNVESQFQDVIENTTDKDVISAPEIIAARGGEANLKARLDKEHQDVTAQLAQIAININTYIDLVSDNDWALAINTAIEDIHNMGGGTLYIPRGNYDVGETIRYKSNVHIKGDHRELTKLTATNEAVKVHMSAVENVSLKNISWDGNNLGTIYNFVHVQSSHNVVIDSNTIKNTVKAGIWVTDLDNGYDPCTNVVITNNLIKDVGLWFTNGIALVSCIGVLVENNRLMRCGINIEPSGSEDETVQEVVVQFNKVTEVVESCIKLYGKFRNFGNITVSNNVLKDSKNGIYISKFNGNVLIENNHIENVEIGFVFYNDWNKPVISPDGSQLLTNITIENNLIDTFVCAIHSNRVPYTFRNNIVRNQTGNEITVFEPEHELITVKGVIHNTMDAIDYGHYFRMKIEGNSFTHCQGVSNEVEFYMVYSENFPYVKFKGNRLERSRGIFCYKGLSGSVPRSVAVEDNLILQSASINHHNIVVDCNTGIATETVTVTGNILRSVSSSFLKVIKAQNVHISRNHYFSFTGASFITADNIQGLNVVGNFFGIDTSGLSPMLNSINNRTLILKDNKINSAVNPDMVIVDVDGYNVGIVKDNILNNTIVS